jgi:glycosyltransferase involved in cell wall biosynthesis
MIRVLHYTRHLGLGGTEKTCQLFFENADCGRFEVALAYEINGTHPREYEFSKSAAVCNGTMYPVGSYENPQSPNGEELQAVINHFKPDILHVYRSGYREFPEPGEHVEVPHFVETNVFGFYDGNARVNKTLFMSKWLMDYTMQRLRPISRGIIPSRFDFVNNPVEQPYTYNILPIAERWRRDNAIIVGRCGRPDNGVRLLRMQGYDIRFLVVAPPSNMVDDLAKHEIPFHMIEPTVDPLLLSTFYNSVDIYTHARADGETFGVNIAEAMMHGRPVITHIATPSVPDMGVFQSQTELVDHGKTGFVVNNNPGEYAEALMALIEDAPLRNRMGEFGRLKAESEYHVDACMHKLESIYQEIMS